MIASAKNTFFFSLRLSAKNFTSFAVRSFLIIAFILLAAKVKSQQAPKHFFSEIGWNIGISAYSILLPEGQHYKPLLLMGNFGWELTKKDKKWKWWIQFEPQLNPVFLDNLLKEAEFGINVAFRYQYKIGSHSYCYAQLGSGPHFITISTDKQAHGFIFSDNLAFGLNNKLAGNWMFNTEFRIRHISNANVMKPNRGMNNLFILIGFSKRINL